MQVPAGGGDYPSVSCADSSPGKGSRREEPGRADGEGMSGLADKRVRSGAEAADGGAGQGHRGAGVLDGGLCP